MSRRLPGHYLRSTEAEYYACSIGTCEGKFFSDDTHGDGRKSESGPLLVGQDNKSCIQIAENPGRHHGCTKHIELKIRWIEGEIKKEKLALVYVPTGQMVADALTKPLSYETFPDTQLLYERSYFLSDGKKGEARSFRVSTRLKSPVTKGKGPTQNGTLDYSGSYPL